MDKLVVHPYILHLVKRVGLRDEMILGRHADDDSGDEHLDMSVAARTRVGRAGVRGVREIDCTLVFSLVVMYELTSGDVVKLKFRPTLSPLEERGVPVSSPEVTGEIEITSEHTTCAWNLRTDERTAVRRIGTTGAGNDIPKSDKDIVWGFASRPTKKTVSPGSVIIREWWDFQAHLLKVQDRVKLSIVNVTL